MVKRKNQGKEGQGKFAKVAEGTKKQPKETVFGVDLPRTSQVKETLCKSGRWIDALKKRGRVLKKRGRVLKKRGRFLRRGV